MFFIPMGLGVVIGIILSAVTYFLKKNGSTYVRIPSYLALISSIVIFIISFEVRGFEGAAYGMLAFTILIFTVITFVMSFTSRNTNFPKKRKPTL